MASTRPIAGNHDLFSRRTDRSKHNKIGIKTLTNGFNSTLGFRQSFGGTGVSFTNKPGTNIPNYEEVFSVNTDTNMQEVMN